MKKTFLFLAIVFPVVLKAQVIYNNGASIALTTGGTIRVNGTAQFQAGSTFTNYGTLTITQNLVNNMTMGTISDSRLVFNGTTLQTLSGSQPYLAKDVEINNIAGVTLSTSLKTDGTFTFTSGIVNAPSPSSPLAFSANGIMSGAGNTSHVNGYVVKEGTGSFVYPVGDGSRYQPVTVDLSTNSNGLAARYYSSDAGTAPFGTGGASAVALESYNTGEYWDISPSGTATGNVTISWDDYKSPVITNTELLTVAHKTGGSWLNEGAETVTGDLTAGSVTSKTVSSWSPFTLGTLPASVLPVRLVSFTAKAEERKAKLQWSIAEADNFSHFEVERSSNARTFETMGRLAFLQIRDQYEYSDELVDVTVAYYRLKMVDLDGSFAYSRIASVKFAGADYAVIGYPNPFIGKITISSPMAQNAVMIDQKGNTVSNLWLRKGNNDVNAAKLHSGIYMIRTQQGESIKVVKE